MVKEIIILTISMGNDGAERILSELSREWRKQGHIITIVQTGAGNYGVSYDLPEDIEMINIRASSSIKPIRYFQEIRKTIEILRQRPNATLISFITGSIFVCGVASFFIKNKIIVSERNNPKECPTGKVQKKLRDWSFCHADVCVFQTEDAMKMFPKRVQKKSVIIPNPINGRLPRPYTGERRRAVVAACRLHSQKNLPMLINAFSMLHKDYPDYTLEIYGQGDEKGRLENQIAELCLEDAVSMPGFVEDIHQKILDAAMYVSSSDYEGISNSMLEALGMGVPAVVTDCPVGGAKMVIQDGINGLLVPVGNSNALYKAMKKIIKDESLAKKMSEEAVKICDKYPLEKISQKWIDVM